MGSQTTLKQKAKTVLVRGQIKRKSVKQRFEIEGKNNFNTTFITVEHAVKYSQGMQTRLMSWKNSQ